MEVHRDFVDVGLRGLVDAVDREGPLGAVDARVDGADQRNRVPHLPPVLLREAAADDRALAIADPRALLGLRQDQLGVLLQERLGIDHLYANELEIKDGVVTGEVVGDIVDGRRKADLLQEIAREEGISLEQVIAVGDGANDLPMLNLAGLGIGGQAEEQVEGQIARAVGVGPRAVRDHGDAHVVLGHQGELRLEAGDPPVVAHQIDALVRLESPDE